ncbi:hypothetical protein L2D08_03335 [Domibacillus sp. PGB-M46]|uniref:hypothetical protein n=1 Tax=Domibacillus sp. PGB-M46 TaxID=2910255 RepID=UPI001F5899A9|nr:hypothetical protein [Domibacillus sp. PGB-M46]MCI2253395.1 hypothetical protein [Domibacillus sp. PGB-M46]
MEGRAGPYSGRLLGFTLAAFCAVMMAVQGVIVPPEGNLLSARLVFDYNRFFSTAGRIWLA